MQDRRNNWKRNCWNAALALAFGALAAALEYVVGRHRFDAAAIISAVLSSYILADKRGGLMEQNRPVTSKISAHGATALYAVLLGLYIVGTDDQDVILMPALFLPVVLAGLCYQIQVGLAVSLGMAAVYVLGVMSGHHTAPPVRTVCAVLSFPGVAVFVRLLAQRLEERFHVMSERANELSDRTSELSELLDMSQELLDMSQMMDAAIDLDTTLNLILLNVQRLSGCQVCAVYLRNTSGEMLELRAASGPRDRMALNSSLPVAEAHCGYWSLEERNQPEDGVAAFYAPNALVGNRGGEHSRLFDLDRRAGSFAVLPLATIDGLLGMLYIGYDAPHGLTGEGVKRLENLAVRAAFSLQRAVSQQGYRSLAFSDAMTGLDNFRQFEQDLGEEMRRAERYDRCVSVILLDIDYFKRFNDTLGHQAGDALLAQLATVLRDSLRSVDKPARYGGEEFVVVCPETGPGEARLIAERIRRNVEQTNFALLGRSVEDGDPGPTRVTVSVGFATFPDNARASRDLVKRADQALYAAKDAGRNSVRGYDDVAALGVHEVAA